MAQRPVRLARPRTAGVVAGDQLLAVDGVADRDESVPDGGTSAARAPPGTRTSHARRRPAAARTCRQRRPGWNRHQRRRHRRAGCRDNRASSGSPRSPAASAGRCAPRSAPTPPRRHRGRPRPARRTPAACSTRRSRSPAPSSTAGPVVSLRAARRPRPRRSTPPGAATRPPSRWSCWSTAAPRVRPRSSPAALQDRNRAVVVGSPHVRQGLGAGAVHPLRRVGARADRGPLPHPGGPQPSTASASSRTSPSRDARPERGRASGDRRARRSASPPSAPSGRG